MIKTIRVEFESQFSDIKLILIKIALINGCAYYGLYKFTLWIHYYHIANIIQTN